MDLKRTLGNIKGAKSELELNLEDIVCKNLDIDDTDIDGEKVMMNLDKGQYFMMNKVGSRIWEIIEQPVKVNDVISTLLSEYEVEAETCKSTVMEFLYKLNKADLIKIQ